MRVLFVAFGAAAIGVLISYGTVSRLAGRPASLSETGAVLSATLGENSPGGKKLFAEVSLTEPRVTEVKVNGAASSNTPERKIATKRDPPHTENKTALFEVPSISAAASGTAAPITPVRAVPEIQSCDFMPKSPKHLVLVNEVAWMGAPARGEDEAGGAQAEWLELKNNSGKEISLEGWRMVSKSGKFKINFEKGEQIPEGGFFLLERGSEETVPEMPSDKIYAGVLSNSGEWLRLFDPQCALVDEVDAAKGWPGGENASKKTLERSAVDLSWNTSANSGGTPRQENSMVYARNSPAILTVSSASPPPTSEQSPSSSSPSSSLSSASSSSALSSASSSLVSLININTASYEELQGITGVGPVLAQRIIDYRTQHGPFPTIDAIKNVSGIGDVTFEKMKSEITVGEVSAVTATSSPPTASAPEKININTAGLAELQKITGVGPTIAQRIIDYRTANGPFPTTEDIKKVKGIGDSTFEKMKNEITI